MFRLYIPSVLLRNGKSHEKFLFMVLHNQFLHWGIIYWSNMKYSVRFKWKRLQPAYIADNIFSKRMKDENPYKLRYFNRIGNKPLKVCMISPYLAIILGPNEHSLWATINNQRLYKFCWHNKYCINCFVALPFWPVDPPSIPTFRNRYGPSLIEFIVHIKSVNGGHLSFYLWFIFHVKTRLLNHCLLVNLSSSL